MHPILATDYGNAFMLVTAGPVLLLALIIGLSAWVLRARVWSIASGLVCIAAGVAFLVSLPEAKAGDRNLTLWMAGIAFVTGLALTLTKRRKGK